MFSLQRVERSFPLPYYFSKEFHTILPTATSVRKAIATKGGEFEASDKEALAHTMSHSVSRADRYCRAYGESKSVQGYDVIGSILQVTTPIYWQKAAAILTTTDTDYRRSLFRKVVCQGDSQPWGN